MTSGLAATEFQIQVRVYSCRKKAISVSDVCGPSSRFVVWLRRSARQLHIVARSVLRLYRTTNAGLSGDHNDRRT